MRICSECSKQMSEGYCIDNGCEYYCCDKCLHKHYTEEEYLDMYDNGEGDSYWTTWDEEDRVMSNDKIDLLEFIEKVAGVELTKWQREFIRSYTSLPPNSQIVSGKGGFMRLITPPPEKCTMEDKMIKTSMIKAVLRRREKV